MSANLSQDAGAKTSADVEANEKEFVPTEWKPQKKELLIMISLSFISLMVALDATILVTVLPVRPICTWPRVCAITHIHS